MDDPGDEAVNQRDGERGAGDVTGTDVRAEVGCALWLRRNARELPGLADVDEPELDRFIVGVGRAGIERDELGRGENLAMSVAVGLATATVLAMVLCWQAFLLLFDTELSWHTVVSPVLVFFLLLGIAGLAIAAVDVRDPERKEALFGSLFIVAIAAVACWFVVPFGFVGIGVVAGADVVALLFCFYLVSTVFSAVTKRARWTKCDARSYVIARLCDEVVAWQLGRAPNATEHDWLRGDGVFPIDLRQSGARRGLAVRLEEVAVVAERGFSAIAPRSLPTVRGEFRKRGEAVAALLRERQSRLLLADPETVDEVMATILGDLRRFTLGDWAGTEPTRKYATLRVRLAKFAVRILLAASLVTIGIGVPKVFPNAVGDLAPQFTIALVSAAVLSFTTRPRSLLESLSGLFSRP